ncbi:MAG TPA: hypothetical protein VJX67_04400 [Blastocatellia bacterium]|nr:hypothetical protein [Blastocatellia bacterium]
MIPPTWHKVFSSALWGIWGKAVDAIRTATRLIIIGFSMPPSDTHFKYLLAAGLRDNISLQSVIFVNPKADHLRTNIFSILREELDGGLVQLKQFAAERLILVPGGLSAVGRRYMNAFPRLRG